MSYLAKTTSKGRDYYRIMESYRDEIGAVKHRVLRNIGSLRDLFDLLPEEVKRGRKRDAAGESAADSNEAAGQMLK
jgi:hypothetical protein